MSNSVSFIHLSDIHFRKFSNDKFDIDNDLRNEIINDIDKNSKIHLENIKGILVCGDIAFSGQEKEYEVAQDFLREICNVLSIPETSVYCVPGNHDVNQNIPYRGSIIHLMQSELEKASTSDEIDAKLAGYSRDKSSDDILFKHIETYNTKFAGKFGCNINTEKPNWELNFELDTKHILRIYGLNSVVISNIDDHKDESKDKPMIIGRYQVPKREDGVVYMSLCHHPPECWNDPNNDLQKILNKRINIQLYGHKHVQEIKQIGNSLIVGSGATHPSRFESDWNPRYNWINIKIEDYLDEPHLHVKIYQRVLSPDGDEFVPDNEEVKEYKIRLNNVNLDHDKNEIENNNLICGNYKLDEEDSSVRQINVDTQTIVYRFLELPFVIQTLILSKYGLLDEHDEGKKYVNIIDKIIEKAKRLDCLDKLLEEINKNY
jgi:predicted phosphodiesterase